MFQHTSRTLYKRSQVTENKITFSNKIFAHMQRPGLLLPSYPLIYFTPAEGLGLPSELSLSIKTLRLDTMSLEDSNSPNFAVICFY